MIKIGIDFSINSTALTINDNSVFTYYSFVPNYKKGIAKFKYHDLLQDFITIKSYNKIENKKTKDKKSDDYVTEQTNKLINADNLSQVILDEIKSIKPDEIRIEGFSFGSKGNSFIDLIMFNSFLKLKLIQTFSNILFIISPKTLKKQFTGNGNANKTDMFNSFLLLNNKLSIKLKEYDIKEDIPKPLDDVIDSFALSIYDL